MILASNPTGVSLLLVAIFTFLLIGGRIQSFAFVDDIPGLEPPPFYDVLRPLSIWPAMILLILPWILLSGPACELIPCQSLGIIIPVVLLLLTYSEAVFAGRVWGALELQGRRLSLLIPAVLTLLPVISLLPIDLIFAVSSFLTSYPVLFAHILSMYGIIRLVGSVLKRGSA